MKHEGSRLVQLLEPSIQIPNYEFGRAMCYIWYFNKINDHNHDCDFNVGSSIMVIFSLYGTRKTKKSLPFLYFFSHKN